MDRTPEGRRHWIVCDGRYEVRLDLDYPWYDDEAGGGDGIDGWTLLERLIDEGLGGIGHNSGLHDVLLEVHRELAGTRLGTWSQGEKTAQIKHVLSDAVDSGRLVVTRQPMQLPAMQNVKLLADTEPVLGPESTPGEEPAPSKTWVGLVLLDQEGAPVPGRPYRVVAPGGDVYDGQTDSNGAAMIHDLDAGSCKISCPYVEPHPELTHTVQPGEHTSGIAQTYGFDDYTVVWNHPNNAQVQSARQDPHVLQPGDVLTIPEARDTPADKPTGAKHKFTIQRSPLKLRLKLLDLAGNPVSGASVTVGGQTLTTGGDGVVEAPVDKSAPDQTIELANTDLDLLLGDLNPTDDDTVAGWKARLFNLGFLWDPTVDDDDDEMVVALQDFQAQYGLPVNGQLDDATKAQLQQVYGA